MSQLDDERKAVEEEGLCTWPITRRFTWRGWRMARSVGRRDGYVWFGPEPRAVELIGDSNGWFRWRDGAVSHVVWSSGNVSDQSLYAAPWEEEGAEVELDHRLALVGSGGPTWFVPEADGLEVTLTDGQRLVFSPEVCSVGLFDRQGARLWTGGVRL